MSLLDAFLLEAASFDVWIAYRTDAKGCGTAEDPYNGAPAYDGGFTISSLTNPSPGSGDVREATVTTGSAHGYSNGDVVTIVGVGGVGSERWNGTFVIFSASGSQFKYYMAEAPAAAATLSSAKAYKVLSYRFDEISSTLPARMRIHLGPTQIGLPFLTRGYADGVSGGWQPKVGMKIFGSGIDVSVLRLVASQSANAHFYAVGHALTTGSPAVPNPLDFVEVGDMTIDCNQMIPLGTAVACGGVRLMGSHTKVNRVKAINWGTTDTSRSCYVLAVITGDQTAGLTEVFNCGIENCIAIQPAASPSGAPVTILHAGSVASAGSLAEAYGRSPFIRNCAMDGGGVGTFGELRGLSMSWCRGGVVEGNHVYNLTYGGPYQDKTSTYDVIVRNNYFRNVAKGPFWNLGIQNSPSATSLSGLARDSGDPTIAVATASADLGLQVAERVKIGASGGPSQYQGVFVIKEVNPGTNQFKYQMTSDPGGTSPTSPTVQKVFGANRIIAERNTIELATDSAGLIALHVHDNTLSAASQAPDYVHGDVIIRDNKVRYLDGAFDSGFTGYAIQANGVKNLIISNNVVECAPTHPLKNQRCGNASYFNNRTPGGVLAQGWNEDNTTKYGELETDAEDAFVLALLERR